MSERPAPDLASPKGVGPLLGEALGIYRHNFGTFFAIALAVIVPVQLIVSGIGLEQLTSGYEDDPGVAEALVPTLVSFLVVAPLITATAIHALRALAAAEKPRPVDALQAGLDAFAPVFGAILIAAIGIAAGLTLFIVPGVFLAVIWFFVPQAVVVEGKRGTGALARSNELVRGNWWRCFGIVLIANLAAAFPGLLILTPIEAAARSADSEAVALAGRIAVETLTAPFVAIVATLLYYDLRSRA